MVAALRLLAAVVRHLTAVCGWIAVACLIAACAVVCQMVFMRYLLEASTIWQTEFVLYAVVAATLLGSPRILKQGGHVSVDLLGQVLGLRARRWQQVFASLIGLLFALVLAASGWRYFYEAWANGWVTESVWAPPLWIVLLSLPLGVGTLCLQYLVEIGELIAGREAVAGASNGKPHP
jgi:TRAP-type C4-dicarboxylate transport system permease small subunit